MAKLAKLAILQFCKILQIFGGLVLSYFLANIDFDTAENGPSKIGVTGIPVYRYKHRSYRYNIRICKAKSGTAAGLAAAVRAGGTSDGFSANLRSEVNGFQSSEYTINQIEGGN